MFENSTLLTENKGSIFSVQSNIKNTDTIPFKFIWDSAFLFMNINL